MKKYIILWIAVGLTACNSTQKTVETSTQSNSNVSSVSSTKPEVSGGIPVAHNQKFVSDYMDETYQTLKKATENLTDSQLHFKPSPEKWSIAECLEHIVSTEPMIFGYVKSTMENPANPDRKKEIKLTDDDILVMIVDRSHKASASEEMKPSGKFSSVKNSLETLQSNRKNILNDLKNFSMEDMRNHVLESPMGLIDAYQFMLIIPGHTSRHTMQIFEIINDPKFPK